MHTMKRGELSMGNERKEFFDKRLTALASVGGAAFFVGILLPCFLWKRELPQMRSTVLYLLALFQKENADCQELFWELMRTRGAYSVLWMLSGFTIFGIPCSLVTIMWMGFTWGALLTLYILQFGLLGGLFGVVHLFPQGVLYLPVTIIFSVYVWDFSLPCWKNRSFMPGNIRKYLLYAGLFLLLEFLGILLESYINPSILKIFLAKWNFF